MQYGAREVLILVQKRHGTIIHEAHLSQRNLRLCLVIYQLGLGSVVGARTWKRRLRTQVQVEHCNTKGGVQAKRQQGTGPSVGMGLAMTTANPARAVSAANVVSFMLAE
jgi:hypothetical protein